MFAVYVVALLCWMSVSHSAPLECENLIRPSDQVDLPHLEGRWDLIASSAKDPAHLEKFKSRDSASITFANHSDTSEVSFTRIYNVSGSCQYLKSNITLQGSGFTVDESNVTVTVLQTSCQDCVVMQINNKLNTPVQLYLLNRKRDVEQKDLEEFKAQAECLEMPELLMMDPTKGLCPEQISVANNAPTEEKTDGQQA